MRYILYLTLPLLLCAKTTFITQEEYAAQLYKNPRGIGCQHCHGEKGEGKIVAKYIHKGVKKSFRGPNINNLDYAAFYKALNKRLDSMPRYFLTSKEVSALYFYLNEDELKKAQEIKKAKEEQEFKKVKEEENLKKEKETKKVKEIKEEKVATEIKEETKEKVTEKTQEVKEIAEIKEDKKTTETVDINALFKEATEAKNAK